MITNVGFNLLTYVRKNWSGAEIDANERDKQFEEYAQQFLQATVPVATGVKQARKTVKATSLWDAYHPEELQVEET